MQQQDFPRGKQAVVSEVEIKRRRCTVHCPNEKGLVYVSQKDLRSTLEPLVQPMILSAYED